MVGGTGNDFFILNNDGDVVQGASASAVNTIQSSVSVSLPTNVNTLILTTNYGETGTANAANDSLVADFGFDTLVAGTGNDTLVGNAESDTYVINAGFGQDQIVSASHGNLVFGSGILKSNLTFSAALSPSGGAPSLMISGAGGAATIQGGLIPGVIDSVGFADGSSYSVGKLVAPSGRATVIERTAI